jgi:chromosomal replication initiator protein
MHWNFSISKSAKFGHVFPLVSLKLSIGYVLFITLYGSSHNRYNKGTKKDLVSFHGKGRNLPELFGLQQMHRHASFEEFVACPENRGALAALQDLVVDFESGSDIESPFIFLHGPPGTGKSHLIQALVQEITNRNSSLTASLQDASALVGDSAHIALEEARDADLFVLEDLQHLAPSAVEPLIQVIDDRLARHQATIFTARTGLKHLGYRGEPFRNRLLSRLGARLVIAIEPLQSASRSLVLESLARRRQLVLSQEILGWLADSLAGGGRQLLGAIHQLELLKHSRPQPLDLATVAGHFGTQVDAARPTVERIALRVSHYFRVPTRQLQSRQRYRNISLPRQVGMYLARRLTRLSLEQIGAYFGGRDHSTVLHACRTVANALEQDAGLSGAVRQLHAELA